MYVTYSSQVFDSSLNARQSLQVLGQKHETGELYTGNHVSSVMFAHTTDGHRSTEDQELVSVIVILNRVGEFLLI